jgi:hypothetical protein
MFLRVAAEGHILGLKRVSAGRTAAEAIRKVRKEWQTMTGVGSSPGVRATRANSSMRPGHDLAAESAGFAREGVPGRQDPTRATGPPTAYSAIRQREPERDRWGFSRGIQIHQITARFC